MKQTLILVIGTLFFTACNPFATSNESASPESDQMREQIEQAEQEIDEAVDTAQNALDTDSTTTLTLNAQNNSGQTGTATISKVSETETKVVLNLTGGNYTMPQPAHIHTGTCQQPGPVVYPLTNVVDGMSETTLTAKYEEIIDPVDAEYILNVHESAARVNVYTACAEWDD